MAFIQAIKKRIEDNDRIIKSLKEFQQITSQRTLCQTHQHLLTKKGKKLKESKRKFIAESWVIFLHLIGGTLVKKASLVTGKHINNNMTYKKWYQSKTVWSALLKQLVGILSTLILVLNGDMQLVEFLPVVVTTLWAAADVVIRFNTKTPIK